MHRREEKRERRGERGPHIGIILYIYTKKMCGVVWWWHVVFFFFFFGVSCGVLVLLCPAFENNPSFFLVAPASEVNAPRTAPVYWDWDAERHAAVASDAYLVEVGTPSPVSRLFLFLGGFIWACFFLPAPCKIQNYSKPTNLKYVNIY